MPIDTFVDVSPADIEAFVERHQGRGYLYEAFEYAPRGSAMVDASPGFKSPPQKQAPGTAEKCVLRALEFATGRSNTERMVDKTSGAHGQRKVLPEVAQRLGWDEDMLDILGDWAAAPKDKKGAPSARATRSKPSSLKRRTAKASYHARASKAQQVRARRLAVEAARVAIRLGGGGAIAPDATWHDLIPEVKPRARSEKAELAKYYGLTLVDE